MNINTNFNAGMINWNLNQETQTSRSSTSSDSANFALTDQFNSVMSTVDDIRPAELMNALSRVGQVDWPPREVMVKIANILALNMQSQISNQ